MPRCARRKEFIVPFTQLDRTIQQPIVSGTQTHSSKHGEWSPVHIGRDAQSVTPSTKKKIKQRLAHGLAYQYTRQPERDISPGIVVPVEFSQISCVSDITDNEPVVCGDVAEFDKFINEEQNYEKHPATENRDEVFGLEIEYDDEPSKDITDKNNFNIHQELNHISSKGDNITSFLPANKVEQKETGEVTDACLESFISYNYSTDLHVDISDESLNGTKRKKCETRVQRNTTQINHTSNKTADIVRQESTDENPKSIKPNTEDKPHEVVDLLLPNRKTVRKQMKKIKVTHSNIVPSNRKKRSGRTVTTTLKPRDKQRMKQQVKVLSPHKTSTNKLTKRDCTKQSSDYIKRDVLKTMLKLHEKIVELQRRRRHLMIEINACDKRQSKPLIPLGDEMDKCRVQGITEE